MQIASFGTESFEKMSRDSKFHFKTGNNEDVASAKRIFEARKHVGIITLFGFRNPVSVKYRNLPRIWKLFFIE